MRHVLTLTLLVSVCYAYQDAPRIVDTLNFSTAKTVDNCTDSFQIVGVYYYGNKTIRQVESWVCVNGDEDDYRFKREPVESAEVVEITVANKDPYAPGNSKYGNSDEDDSIPNYRELTFYVKAEAFDQEDLESLKKYTKRNWHPGAHAQRVDIIKGVFVLNQKLGERTVTAYEEQCTACGTAHHDSDFEENGEYCFRRDLQSVPAGQRHVKYVTLALKRIKST